MFSGIVRAQGRIQSIDVRQGRVRIWAPVVARQVKLGDSVSVDGICLTVTRKLLDGFGLDVTPETIRRTHLKWVRPGWLVNLELSLRVGDALHGHLVLGHVDGVGVVRSLAWPEKKHAPYKNFYSKGAVLQLYVPEKIAPYLAEKGSVSINGVSLTIAFQRGKLVGIALIPETLRRTNLRFLRAGSRVNVEVDVLARYIRTGYRKRKG
ncbi:riboflavin synthase [bacterium]|nr:riboflavin synthase [bacterium]